MALAAANTNGIKHKFKDVLRESWLAAIWARYHLVLRSTIFGSEYSIDPAVAEICWSILRKTMAIVLKLGY